MAKLPKTEHNPECTDCALHSVEGNNRVCIPGDGPRTGSEKADILIVAEAPGKNEDRAGRPLVGKVGQFLRKRILIHAGIDPELDSVRFSNAVRCRPPKNRTPRIREIDTCRKYLEAEVRRVRPKVIAVVGNVPLASVLNHAYKDSDKSSAKVSGIGKWAGKVFWHREFGAWAVPTQHPSYVDREWSRGHEFPYDESVAHFELVNKYAHKPRYKPSKVDSIVLDDEASIHAMLDEMEAADVVAFDIETGGEGDRACDKWPIGFSLSCSKQRGYYVSWDWVRDRIRSRLESLLTASPKKRTLVMHGGAFELRVLWHNGYRISARYWDTMLAANTCDENFPQALKDLSWIHTDFGGYELELDRYKKEHKIKGDYSQIPFEILSPYGGYDAVATLWLYYKFKKQMIAEGTYSGFSRVLMPIRRVFSNAEYTGIRFDSKRAKKLGDIIQEGISRYTRQVYDEVGYEFNIRSGAQLSRALYNDLRLPTKFAGETKLGTKDDPVWETNKEVLGLYTSTRPRRGRAGNSRGRR